MKITEVENLSFEVLKKRAKELPAKVLEDNIPQEVAARYIQARTDAKHWGEKLAEQGRMITALTEGNEALKQQVNVLEKSLQQANEHLESCGAKNENLASQNGELTEKLNAETARANRLKVEANRANEALTAAEKALKDAVAARQIDAADRGE